MRRHPDAVLVGAVAARVTSRPEIRFTGAEVAVPSLPRPAAGFRFSRRRIRRLHEDKAEMFWSDRWRHNALVLAGWRVVRFTFETVRDHPEVMVATLNRLLRSDSATPVAATRPG